MTWNRTGTVSVTNGSQIVNGVGTSWIANARVSEAFKGPDGQLYEIQAINSDVQMTLASPYLGGTGGGQGYVIVPTQGYMRDLATQAAALINQFADVVNGPGAGKFAGGSPATPSLRGLADLDSGINLPGGDVVQVVTGGAVRIQTNADGSATFNGDVAVVPGRAITTPTVAISGGTGAMGVAIGPGDGASATLANLKIYSWFGIGLSPTITGSAVPAGQNSHWFDTRSGYTGMRGSCSVGSNLRVGQAVAWGAEAHTFQSNTASGTMTAAFGGVPGPNVLLYAQNGAAANAAACSLWVNAASTTGRGFNSGGSINASGSDYAEYHYTVDYAVGRIAKGQVIGLTANDEVTDRWSDAVSGFALKSTDPSLVGGDTWATVEVVGTAPVYPHFVEPARPAVQLPEDAEPAEQMAVLQAAEDEFRIVVAAARAAYEAGPLAAYNAAKAAFDAVHEEARKKVDRIAYSGRVPVNVLGARPGDYIVAAEGEGDSIVGRVVTAAEMRADMTRYLNVVGRVRSILPDGRANCAVVIH